ncbi:Eco57I restriction-modification methylase domain-containing protein [Anabaena sp. FACHB-1237]|uniref:Eco57I restriction-modification methylase domain-containing protein n=1 Tax=Anabaena sp. FACHB-1237 TaxID=2692769 RepID=UPI00167FE98D|nr:DNA methyltransferase [Anabaena sp. FACHB-1237]MBD2138292.1 Eco57I restriction-modification methylase domain-containing protein [Anabaena sp. FACHB-1237]
MKFNRIQVKKHLQSFNFTTLFIEELGWDYTDISPIYLTVDMENYKLTGIAQKRGLMVYHCFGENGKLPINKTRRKIDEEMTNYSHEHLIIYTDEAQKQQIWQWVRREPGKPVASRENNYHIHQSGESLIQKLEAIYISLAEEENLTLSEVTKKTKKAFDVDKVTKKFYENFKKEYSTFLGFINGIPVKFDQEWYASLMLNRLMFIYFIQRKGFLNNDLDYLRTKLNQCQQNNEQNNQFYSFYRYFLLRLFHNGLGSQNRTPELETLLGKIPYLNGGLFTVHYLEQTYPEITIQDTAFTQIFNFFDQYNWYLDERPLKNDHEINPDVLGYIFEKYINQKQMGAYYTKEDITEYISKNCIIPYLFDAVKSENIENYDIWNLLKDNPERYIYEAVKKGVNLPLPDDIAIGLNDIAKRQSWNLPADENYGLPTEIWREYITRKNRYVEIREKLVNGEVKSINDLITYNLNIRQFAEDVINNCQKPQFLYNIYQQLGKMSILDPTCGSGAFLFAAVNVLEPLYDACLEKMTSFIEDNDKDKTIKQFQQILNDVKVHHNRRYFILKKIMLNNLYGVDIMEEATEICKLRLFLKLAAQVTPNHSLPNYGIEPLPDIDFNIRAGNSLVGFASYDEVKKAVEGSQQLKLDLFSDMTRIDEKAKRVSEVYQTFRDIQSATVYSSDFTGTKQVLQESLDSLNEELNEYLAREYGIDVKNKQELEKWKLSHRPFHWFVEFYGIINRGGFDVIIGNPPYLEYKDIKDNYQILDNITKNCSNLFAYILEKCTFISHIKSYIGMIIPLSAFSTDRMQPLINYIKRTSLDLYLANFSWRPGKLFDGVNLQLTIMIQKIGYTSNINNNIYTTKYILWESETRNELFSKIEFILTNDNRLLGSILKLGYEKSVLILDKLRKERSEIGHYFTKKSNNIVFYRRGGLYWKVFVDFTTESSEEKIIYLLENVDKYLIIAVLSSNIWFWYFTITSDCRHLGNRDINTFPLDIKTLPDKLYKKLVILGRKYVNDLKLNAENTTRVYKGKKTVECLSFKISKSKPIIDEIDKILAEHYGLTEEELDFIINYDIKYRMGKELAEEDN